MDKKETINYLFEQIREVEHFWEDPKRVLALIDLLFLGGRSGQEKGLLMRNPHTFHNAWGLIINEYYIGKDSKKMAYFVRFLQNRRIKTDLFRFSITR